jgi:hypothetical protein
MEERILAWPGLRSVQAFRADTASFVVITHWNCEASADAATSDMDAALRELGPFLTAPPSSPMKSIQLLGGRPRLPRGRLEGPLAALASGSPPKPADVCAGAPLASRSASKTPKGILDRAPEDVAEECAQQ